MADLESLDISSEQLPEFKAAQKQLADFRIQELQLKGQLFELMEKRHIVQKQLGVSMNVLLLEAGVKENTNTYIMSPDFTKIIRKPKQ